MHLKSLLALLCFGVGILLAPPAAAQNADEAARLTEARGKFQQAIELEQAGNWGGALRLFREVGQVRMTPQVRFHIGVCEENLGRLAVALGSYELALRDAESVGGDFSVEVTQKVEALRARIPKIVVERGPGAEAAIIELDGVALGASSIGIELPVDPGPHAISARAPGHEAFAVTVNAAEGGKERVKVELERSRSPETPPADQHDVPARADRRGVRESCRTRWEAPAQRASWLGNLSDLAEQQGERPRRSMRTPKEPVPRKQPLQLRLRKNLQHLVAHHARRRSGRRGSGRDFDRHRTETEARIQRAAPARSRRITCWRRSGVSGVF